MQQMHSERPLTPPQQNVSGAFRCELAGHHHVLYDYNGFVTALILREMQESDPRLYAVQIEKALKYLRCYKNSENTGYRFWPLHLWPDWAPSLPADCDDIAVISLELAKHNELTDSQLLQLLESHLFASQIKDHPPSPTWLKKGAFRTWVDGMEEGNPVDCCVNLNILVLFAYLGMKDIVGYHEVVQMLYDAVEWCGDSELRFRSLAIFYPDSRMFLYTLDNAIVHGCSELLELREILRKKSFWPTMRGHGPISICSNANHKIIWTSEFFDYLLEARYEGQN